MEPIRSAATEEPVGSVAAEEPVGSVATEEPVGSVATEEPVRSVAVAIGGAAGQLPHRYRYWVDLGQCVPGDIALTQVSLGSVF